MKKLKNILLILSALAIGEPVGAQDPSFSQFFSSPLNINPALTGAIHEKWRILSNFRSQWIGAGDPYTTGTLSVDSKIFQNTVGNYVDENTRVAIGGMMMYDQTMSGAMKSNYASFNASGNLRLRAHWDGDYYGNVVRHNNHAENDLYGEQRLGLGFGIIYGNRRLDPTKLTFEEQFTGNGFDTNLPTGETSLANMKPYISMSTGLLYSYIKNNTNFDFGVAAFHFNKPKQTFLSDENQYLAARYVVHSNYETFLSDQVILNANGIYQNQGGASYFSIGGALGYFMPGDEKDMIVNGGIWYWSNNSVIPYVGFSYGNFQCGLTYDITVSKLRDAPRKPQTFELCLILRGGKKHTIGDIPSPWK